MCGRYRRTSDKQRIAEAFHVKAGLEELLLDPEDDIAPGSVQPVIFNNEDGERQIEMMRWGFKLPDRLLFNARSEGIATASFWKESFLERRCIVPADSVFEWEKEAIGKKPKYEIAIPGRVPFWNGRRLEIMEEPEDKRLGEHVCSDDVRSQQPSEPIHPRQTTFLEPRDYAEYLSSSERPPIYLLRILPEEKMCVRLVEESSISKRQAMLFDPQ